MLLLREITFAAAYDRRDPNPSKNYGVHGLHITFTLRKPDTGDGLTFSIATNWHLPHVQAETDANPPKDPCSRWLFHKPQPFGVDYHSSKPLYEGQQCIKNCFVTGGDCYSDGSALLGGEFFQTLVAGGDEALWARMEEQYKLWRKL